MGLPDSRNRGVESPKSVVLTLCISRRQLARLLPLVAAVLRSGYYLSSIQVSDGSQDTWEKIKIPWPWWKSSGLHTSTNTVREGF